SSLIGADDFPPRGLNDLSVDSLISPANLISAGAQTVTVRITNVGTNTVSSATLSYAINGGPVTLAAWVGSIAAGSSINYTFTTKAAIVAGQNIIKVYTTLPNG